MNDLKARLSANLQKYADKFRETRDFAWLIRHAQEAALLEELNDPTDKLFRPIEVHQLRQIMADEEFGLDEDPVQQLQNKTVSKVLVGYLGALSQRAPVLQGVNHPDAHKGFRAAIWPNTKALKEMGEQIKSHVADASADEDVKARLIEALDQKSAISNAVEHVLNIAYLEIQRLNIYQNPILAFLPADRVAEFVKTAAQENKGARLSDVLEAVRITSGGFTQRLIEIQENIRTVKTERERNMLQKQADEEAHKLLMLNAYEDFLQRALRDLNKLMRENPEARSWRYGEFGKSSKNGPLITDNPFVQSDREEAPYTFGQFLRLSNPVPPDVKTTLWDGREVELRKFAPPQSDIQEAYRMVQMLHDRHAFQDQLAPSLVQNLTRYREFNTKNNELNRTMELSKIFIGSLPGEIYRIQADVHRTLEAAVIDADDDALIEAELGTEELQMLKSWPEGKRPVLDQAIQAHNKAQIETYQKARTGLIRKYETKAAMKGNYFTQAFGAFLDDVWREEIAHVSPADLRALKEADFFGEPKTWTPRTVSEGFKSVFPATLAVLKSPQFKSKYAENDRQYAEYEAQYGTKQDPRLTSIAAGIEKLKKSPALLRKLGYQEVLTNDMVEFRRAFNDMVAKMFTKSVQELQQELGDIPLDSLYAFVAHKYASFVEHDLLCTIACRFPRAQAADIGGPLVAGDAEEDEEGARGGGATSGGGQKDCRPCADKKQPNPIAFDEATTFFKQYSTLAVGERKDQSLSTSLSAGTIAGRVAEWHQRKELATRDPEKSNFANVVWRGAMQHFGAYIDRTIETRLSDELAKNKAAEAEAKAKGETFEWDDPNNPRPTDRLQLATLVGAFADPQPGRKLRDFGAKRFGKDSLEIQPGQRFSPEQIAELHRKPDDVKKSLKRMLMKAVRLGTAPSMRLLIDQLKHAYQERREELLEMNKDFAQDIIPFDLTKPETLQPFAHQGLYGNPQAPRPAPSGPAPGPIDFNIPKPQVELPVQEQAKPKPKKEIGHILSKELIDAEKLIEKAEELSVSSDLAAKEKVLDSIVAKRDMLERTLSGAARELASNPALAATSAAAKTLLTKLSLIAEKIRIDISGIKRQHDEQARKPLRSVIDQILQLLAPPKWSEEGAERLSAILTSLVDGTDEELVMPVKDVATNAYGDLKQILAGVQKLQNDTKIPKIPANQEKEMIAFIEDRLEDKRQRKFHQIMGDEDDHPEFYDAEPVVKKPEPTPTMPKTIIRRK